MKLLLKTCKYTPYSKLILLFNHQLPYIKLACVHTYSLIFQHKQIQISNINLFKILHDIPMSPMLAFCMHNNRIRINPILLYTFISSRGNPSFLDTFLKPLPSLMGVHVFLIHSFKDSHHSRNHRIMWEM